MKVLIASLILAFSTLTANAQEANTTGYAGILIGYADPTNADGRLGYGIDVGMMFPSGVSGLIFGYSSSNKDAGIDESITQYGVGADMSLGYMLGEGFFSRTKAGLKLGMSSLKVDIPAPGTAVDESDFVWGPSVGVDHPINKMFTAGLQADLLIAPDYSTLYIFGTARYWF